MQREDGVTEETAARESGVTVYTRVGCPACEKAEADVARICGVSPRRLRYWERTALVNASTRDGSKRRYAPPVRRCCSLHS